MSGTMPPRPNATAIRAARFSMRINARGSMGLPERPSWRRHSASVFNSARMRRRSPKKDASASIWASPSAFLYALTRPLTLRETADRPSRRRRRANDRRVSPPFPAFGAETNSTADTNAISSRDLVTHEPPFAATQHMRNRAEINGFCFDKNKTLSMPQWFFAIMSNRN